MPKASTRRVPAPPKPDRSHPVLRLLPRPVAPAPLCQATADGLEDYRRKALHGVYIGVVLIGIQPDGNAEWNAFGAAGNHDKETCVWASQMTAAIYRDCYR